MSDDRRTPIELAPAFREAVAAIRYVGARPIVFGGLAANVWGRGRFTDDVDLIVDGPDSLAPKLCERLAERGFHVPEHAATRLTRDGMAQVLWGNVKVDLLWTADPLSSFVAAGASDETVEGEHVAVARGEDLIVMKLLAQRTQDLSDIQSILVTNHDRLDLDRIMRWLPELEDLKPGTTALFEKLKREFHDPLTPPPSPTP